MAELCPYYQLSGSGAGGKGSRAIVIGSKPCLAGRRQMCGEHAICPEAVAKQSSSLPSPEDQKNQVEVDRVDWSTIDSETASAEAETSTETDPPTTEETLGEVIRRLRIEKGLTQIALAASADLSSNNLYRWESGTTRPGLISLRKLDQVLATDLAERFGSSPGGPDSVASVRKNRAGDDTQAAPTISRDKHGVSPGSKPDHNAKRASGLSEPPRESTGSKLDHNRGDYLREFLREASLAREEFNQFLREALEAVRGLDWK